MSPTSPDAAPRHARLRAVRHRFAPGPVRVGRTLLGLTAAAVLAMTATLAGQEEARALLSGRVSKDGSPVEEATVVLHRVTPDSAGPVDSVRVGPDGSFSLELPRVPDPGARSEVWFASVRHQGIMYFGRAVHQAADLDSAYVIEVSDTTMASGDGADLPLSMRHVILEETPDGWQVTELFQVANDGPRTIVAEEGGSTWSHPLPASATEIEAGGTDAPPNESTVTGGRYRVTAAIPPGERQFLVRYRIPGPDLVLPAPGRTRQMELLVREPAPPLDVDGLAAVEAVEMQPGSTFRRYVATGLADTEIVIGAGSDGSTAFSVRWLAVVLGMLLAAAGVWAVMRPRGGSPVPAGATSGPVPPAASAAPAERRRALMLEVAKLDERLDGADLSAREARSLRTRRADLMDRIRALS